MSHSWHHVTALSNMMSYSWHHVTAPSHMMAYPWDHVTAPSHMMAYPWHHITAPESHDVISMTSCYSTQVAWYHIYGIMLQHPSHMISIHHCKESWSTILSMNEHVKDGCLHMSIAESCFTQNGGESLYTMHALLHSDMFSCITDNGLCSPVLLASTKYMYVDSRVSVGVRDGARALGTDFSTHLLIHGLDKLVFSCFCFVFKANRTPSGKKTVTWMQVKKKSAFPSLNK